MSVNHVATAAIFILGIKATLEDIETSKIANKWIAAGLAASAALYLYLGLNTVLGLRRVTFLDLGVYYLPPAFYPKALCHILLGAACAVVLWYLRLWPAGDAKLYIALTSLLTFADFNLTGFPGSLFLVVLVNVFVAAGIYVTAVMVGEWLGALSRVSDITTWESFGIMLDTARKRVTDERVNWKLHAMMIWNTFVLFFIFRMVQALLHFPFLGPTGQLGVYFALFLAWKWLGGFFQRREVANATFFLVTIVLVPVELFLKWDVVSHFLGSWRMTLGFGLFFMVARTFVDYYLVQSRTVIVPVGELRPGMILSEASWTSLKREKDPEAALPLRYADGLSAEDLEAIKVRFTRGAGAAGVAVYRHRPFAFWVFFGVLWAFYCKQNVVQWLITRLPSR